MTSIKIHATNGLVIYQINISNTIQIILTKFGVTVVRFPITYFVFKDFNTRRVFISIGIMLQSSMQNILMSLNHNL